MKHLAVVLLALMLLSAIAPSIAVAQDGPRVVTYEQAISDDGLLTFAYPSKWYIDPEAVNRSGIGIVSDATIVKRDPTAPLESGEVTIFIRLIDADAAVEQGIVGETLEERLTAYVDLMSEVQDEDGNSVYEFGEIAYVDTADLPYAEVTYTLAGNEVTVLFWDVADGLTGIALVRSAPREWILNEEVATTVVLSLRYLGDDYGPLQFEDEGAE